jgi:L-amino acid N-acyltransferase YncA
MSPVRLRCYEHGDAEALTQIFFRSVQEGARVDYTREQVDAWAADVSSPVVFEQRASDRRTVFVAEDDDGVTEYGSPHRSRARSAVWCAPRRC